MPALDSWFCLQNSHPLKTTPKILIFSHSSYGGLAEHTFYQAKALTKAGARVICLAPPAFLDGRKTDFEKIICLANPIRPGGSRVLRRIKMVCQLTFNQMALAWQIVKRRPDLVLLDSYVEYFAPLWIWPHWMLSRLAGVSYAANLHDPVRNYAVGPLWWHKMSVRMAYWPLKFVLVHDKLPEPSPVPARIGVVEVPVGVYEISGQPVDPARIRREWGVKEGQKVFLAFGFVRDGKNLDLALRALAEVPGAFLVVAGSVASSKDKPFAFYRELADKLGVASRCRFFEGFVSDTDLGNFFSATDFALLTYASSFNSQSGVLNIAARARKPVLASASPSPLIESVRNFSLGVAVSPDSVEAIAAGMKQLLTSPPAPDWEAYESAASWNVNALRILELCQTDDKNKS